MAGTEQRRGANIGSSSLILIFIILCLSTFGLLSLSNAKGDWSLADKNAAAVSRYYRADSQGEAFVEMVDQIIAEAEKQGKRQEAFLKENLKNYYREESKTVVTDIPMEYDQALRVELRVTPGSAQRYEIAAWKVYNQQDYEIDDSMPVWTGES